MSGFQLKEPLWLLLWIPLLVLGMIAIRRQQRAAIVYSSVSLVKQLPRTMMQRMKGLLPWVRLLGLALLVFALARPQRGLHEFRIRTEGIAIQMCIDRSGSMEALDFELDGRPVNRLRAVKAVFRSFVQGGEGLPGRPDDMIGLISFGGFAEGKSPLTLDHGALLEVLKTIEIPRPIEDAQGNILNRTYLEEEMQTAIGDAVALAVDRLKESKAASKVIILLSDGENTAGVVPPEEAAKAAKAFGVKIYAIGVGSTGRAPFPGVDLFGRRVLQSRHVNLDEKTLKMLAETTSGAYYNAKDTETLKQVYREIDQLEKTPSEGRMYTEYVELYLWFLLAGLALLLLDILLRATRFRSLP
jgi:Ca-activated chloride channel family protein